MGNASEGPSAELQAWTCAVCPAQELAPGRFDVAARPGPDSRYEPATGWRVDLSTRAPTCVHPYRVGLPPGAYASAGAPLPPRRPLPPDPRDLALPDDPTLLEAWFVAVLRSTEPERMRAALAQAEQVAGERFPGRTVVAAVRRVMSTELAR
ncbi:hypothetical protein [Catellatospora vulcania]|uniref:hypothetical protein n=1 Tax=Catellatospora vulcania TaxID=1460450 RepID=UPI001E59D331|nr:hypothetical protein [Catellatospora vulcania]